MFNYRVFKIQEKEIIALNIIQLGLYCYCVFHYPQSFSSDLLENKQYDLIFFSLPILTLSCIYRFVNMKKNRPQFGAAEFFSLLLSIIILSYSIINPAAYNLSNEHFSVVLYLIIASVLFNMTKSNILLMFWKGMILVYLIEIAIYIRQFILFRNEHAISFILTGSLKYSAIFSCYAVLHLPILFYFVSTLNVHRHIKNGIVAVFILFSIGVIYIAHSRTALIALIIITVLSSYHRIRTIIGKIQPYLKIVFFFACIVILSALGYYLFYLKKLSAFGRIMMSDIAYRHITEHVWFGTGLGRFSLYYPQWQSDYFKTFGDSSKNYFLSAGETYNIYNDLLQLFMEIGIIGSIVLILVLIDFFRSDSKENKGLLICLKINVIAILSCGLTYNAFHMIPLMSVFILSLSTAYQIRDNHTSLFEKRAFYNLYRFILLLSIVITSAIYWTVLKEVNAVRKFSYFADDYALSNDEIKEKYQAAYPDLKYNGKFLAKYGQFLSRNLGDTKQAILILQESKKHFISYESIESLAETYKMAKDYNHAIACYEFLSFYIPSLFYPRYEIVKLYEETGDIKEARKNAEIILKIPVKKPSDTIDLIKSEMDQFLLDNPSN